MGKRLEAHYAGSSAARDRAIQAVTWAYPEVGAPRDPDPEAVQREIAEAGRASAADPRASLAPRVR